MEKYLDVIIFDFRKGYLHLLKRKFVSGTKNIGLPRSRAKGNLACELGFSQCARVVQIEVKRKSGYQSLN